MALFQVKGWDLKEEKIALGGVGGKKKKSRKEKKAKQAEAQVEESKKRKHEQDENIDEETKPEETSSQQESKDELPSKKAKKPKKDKKNKSDHDKQESSSSKSEQITAPVPITSTAKLTPLQQKMMAKLSGSRFRWINEQLYTTTSESALKLIQEQPSLFDEYHQGFRSQVQSWPENPVNVFVDQIKTRASTRPVNAPGGLPGLPNKKVVVADMGCGEAQLALDVSKFVKEYARKNKGKKPLRNGGARNLDIEVHSFDLKKYNDRITVADIKNVPLPDGSCTIVIFCLALMGTNFLDFIDEAYRLLAPRGELWIAEIKSRFTESSGKGSEATTNDESIGQEFVETLKLCGFFHKNTDNSNKMFSRFEFFKPPQDIIQERKAKLERRKKFLEEESEKEKLESRRSENPEGEWLLKPCIYKRR